MLLKGLLSWRGHSWMVGGIVAVEGCYRGRDCGGSSTVRRCGGRKQ